MLSERVPIGNINITNNIITLDKNILIIHEAIALYPYRFERPDNNND